MLRCSRAAAFSPIEPSLILPEGVILDIEGKDGVNRV